MGGRIEMGRRKCEFRNPLIAITLACVMVFGSLIGSLDSMSVQTSMRNNEQSFFQQQESEIAEEMPLRMSSQLVYDSESDRIIFFGGAIENLETDYDDTWSYDYNTNTWTNMSPATNPPASEWHQMAYDSGDDKIVLFGGHVSGTGSSWVNHNETWVYDYNANTWTDMDPILAPPAFSGGTMAYDSESDLLVVFGGWPNGGIDDLISETWTYDLSSNTWTNVTTDTQPGPRSWATMTYDSESDLIVFFGGFGSDWTVYSDTWTYDVDTNTWTEISTVGPELIGDLAYDVDTDLVVFYGGAADLSEAPEDLRSEAWTYDTDTETWENMDPDTNPPSRSRGEIVYDSESKRVILYEGVIWGGWPDEEVLYDCWAYDFKSNIWNNVAWDWQEMTPLVSPGVRTASPLAYDIESDRMVIFGGWASMEDDATIRGDTWTYDYNENNWTNMAPSVHPSARAGHAMAYNEKSDVMVLFGGSTQHQSDDEYYVADTWTYDLDTNTWTNMSPATNPDPIIYGCMGYDNESDIIILFGGFTQEHDASYETWAYNLTANTWTNMTIDDHPSKRFYAGMPYDYESDLLILGAGGSWEGFQKDLWSYDYDSNNWSAIVPVNDGPYFGFGTTYDLGSKIVVAYGGPPDISETNLVSRTFIYNMTTGMWNDTYSRNNPSARSRICLAYDIESDRTIMFGGALPASPGAVALGDTWAYDYRVNPPLLIPGKVKNLVATVSGSDIILTWQAPDPIPNVDITGYNVYRGDTSGTYELLFELGNTLTYNDTLAGFGITYYYAVSAFSEDGEGDLSDETSSMRPWNPADDGVYSFVVYGDTRAGDETAVAAIHDDLVSKYLQYDPEFVIHSGDMVYHGGEAYQWPLFNDSISALYDWDPSMVMYGAVGNHEWYTDDWGTNDEDFSTYRDFFDFSDVVDEAGETELYYSFDWQGIHFIILNTVEDWNGDNYNCPTAQMEWLESDLAKGNDIIIVISHYPFYSILDNRPERLDQAESLRDEFHTLFVEYGVDAVFMGHNHYYYRTTRDNIQYVTSAGGGAPLYEIQKVGTDWITGDIGFSEYHYCVASIIGNNLQIHVVLINGTVADSFNIQIPSLGLGPMQILLIGAALGIVAVVVIIIYYKKRQ